MEYTERTKAEQIANAYFDMGAGWSASGGLLKELREMEDGYIKQLADAQATIAALQAERDEYKTMYACLTGETYDNPIADLKAQLTQRTAELEAVEKILDIDTGKTTVEKVRDLHHSFKQVWESYQDASNEMFKAQAELERVRGELAHAKKMEAVQKEVADNQTWHVQKLRTLIL